MEAGCECEGIRSAGGARSSLVPLLCVPGFPRVCPKQRIQIVIFFGAIVINAPGKVCDIHHWTEKMNAYWEKIFFYAVLAALFMGSLGLGGALIRRNTRWALALAAAAAWAYAAFALPSMHLKALFLLLSAGYLSSTLPEGWLKKAFASAFSSASRGYEHMDLWLETTEKISSRMDSSEIKSFLAEVCARSLGASPVNVWLLDGASLSFTANTLSVEPGLRRISPEHPLIGRIKAASGQPFLLKEALAQEDLKSLAEPLRAEVCVPLIAHREITGFILAGRAGRKPFSGGEMRLLAAIAAQAAVQLKNVRLQGELLDMKESDMFNRMSSFIAHDLKNVTNSLALLSHNARRNISDPAFQREALKALEATVDRMRALSNKMAGGLRSLDIRTSWCDLREVLGRAVTILSPEGRARLVIEPGSSLPCLVDVDLVETVFLNLLTNAVEATDEKGQIRVSFRQEDGAVCAVIEDDGAGIPLPFLENGLFRPFRSTKKDGFGIGLCQCRAVMEAHGGTIAAVSEEGKGASFTLRFPLPAAAEAC